MYSLNIKETISDNNSDYAIKRFRLGALTVDRPMKVTDARHITESLFSDFQLDKKTTILESSKEFRVSDINHIMALQSSKDLKEKLNYKEWFREYPFVLSSTLAFNPFNHFQNLDEITGYLDYHYIYSNPFVLAPSIRIPDISKKKEQIDVNQYIQYLDHVIEILSYKNKKPIFVPIPLRYDIQSLGKLAEYCLKKELFCIWFDFDRTAMSKANIARIRYFLRIFNLQERIDDLVIYSTNLTRALQYNMRDSKNPASDVLASLVGSTFIGVNREPQRFGSDPKKKKEQLLKHKARIFDVDNYYYITIEKSSLADEIKRRTIKKKFNINLNSGFLDYEFNSQAKYFLENQSLRPYLAKKAMLKHYTDGRLLDSFFGFQSNLKREFRSIFG